MRARLDHVAVNVRDVSAMMQFYAGVLGLEPLRQDLFEAGKVLFPSVRLSEHSILDFFPAALWEKDFVLEATTRRSRMNHLCLALSEQDFAACEKRLEQAGVEVLIGPAPRWGAHGTGTSIYVLDPEGNMVELRKYAGDETGEALLS